MIEAALAKHGRKREDIEINAWPWIAINPDKKQAIDDARPTVAAYSGYKQYEPFFEKQGFGTIPAPASSRSAATGTWLWS